MAAIINLAFLSKEQIETIYSCLVLQPQKGFFGGSVDEPAMFFLLSEDKKTVKLPYRFACSLIGGMVNQDIPHRSIECKMSIQPRDYQIEPLLEAKEYLFTYGTVTLGLFPGWGKTIAGAWLANLAKLSVMVLTHRDNISKQWVKTFNMCLPDLVVWLVDENPPPDNPPDVIICLNTTRIDKVPQIFKDLVGTLIVDEAHLFCTAKKAKILLSVTPKYVIIETATLERDDGMHNIIYALAGTHNVSKISKSPYYVFQIETNIYVQEKQTKFGTDYGQLCKSYSASEERNNMVIDIVKNNPHKKFMIVSRLSDHVTLLKLLFEKVGLECSTLYKSQDSYKDSPILIGTVPKMGTGFDEASFCDDYKGIPSNVIIILHSIKKWQLYEQVRGRVMRSKNPIIIWFHDLNKVGCKHFKKLIPWMHETNATIVHIQYSPGGILLPP